MLGISKLWGHCIIRWNVKDRYFYAQTTVEMTDARKT